MRVSDTSPAKRVDRRYRRLVGRMATFVLYRNFVKRVVLFAVLLILFADASGAMAFVSTETCSGSETVPDQKCPPLCVRCGCCAQPIVPTAELTLTSVLVTPTSPVPYTAILRVGSPHDILHVPK